MVDLPSILYRPLTLDHWSSRWSSSEPTHGGPPIHPVSTAQTGPLVLQMVLFWTYPWCTSMLNLDGQSLLTPSSSMEGVKSHLVVVWKGLITCYSGPSPKCTSMLNLDGQSLLTPSSSMEGVKSQVVVVWKGLITCHLRFSSTRVPSAPL